MDEIAELATNSRPQEIYNRLVTNKDINSTPRNSRVVRNKVTNARRANKEANGAGICSNFADEIKVVFDMLKTDNFVRQVFAQKDSVPCVALNTDRQLTEIKGMWFDNDKQRGSVLGVEKTYNLGSAYVTIFVYKNVALNQKRTAD